MKKEEMELKEVIKAAILEAFAEMYGVATLDDTDDSAPEEEDGEGDKKEDDKGEGGKKENGSIRPGTINGPVGFNLR